MGHLLMESRNGLAVGAALTQATVTAGGRTALALPDRCGTDRRITLGVDETYDVAALVEDLRDCQVTPHEVVCRGSRPGPMANLHFINQAATAAGKLRAIVVEFLRGPITDKPQLIVAKFAQTLSLYLNIHTGIPMRNYRLPFTLW